MDKRIMRFTHCDQRFYQYVETVLERLPVEVKEGILDNAQFQIIAGEDLHDMCALRYEFETPITHLVYLNTKGLMEPEHRLIYTIAHEIALYIAGEHDTENIEKKAEELLTTWGFEKEIEAVRYASAIAESEGYKTGYAWAKKQNKDYLMLHFGLYFDEWNEKGLGRMSREQFEGLKAHAGTAAILEDVGHAKEGRAPAPFSLDEAIIAGIMTAVKEIRVRETYSPKTCDTGDM
jgi:hypothetical protein